jgi:four helix bundle protein
MAGSSGIKSYRDLRVWQEAMELVEEVYRLTAEFRADERFGLVAQARDAVISIPSNIAEGHGRGYRKDYLRHVSIAEGSLAELETHIEAGVRLAYCSRERVARIFRRCALLGTQLKSLRTALSKPVATRPSPVPGPRSPIPQ